MAISFATSAQDIYSIAKPLRLGTVPVSESSADSVLVYTAGKMVKLVPRSEFGGGGGQDLAQTLANGNWASTQIELFEGNVFKSTKTEGNFVQLGNGGVQGYNPLTSSVVSLRFDNRESEGDVILNVDPIKPAGEYVVATTSDFKTVNGESIVGEGDITIHTPVPSLEDIINENPETEIPGIFSLKSQSETEYLIRAEIFLDNTQAGLFSRTETGLEGIVRTQNGMVDINQSIDGGLNTTNITFETPIVTNTTLKFPAKPAGTYVLATLDDISGGALTLDEVLEAGGIADGGKFITLKDTDTFVTYLTPTGFVSIDTDDNQKVSIGAQDFRLWGDATKSNASLQIDDLDGGFIAYRSNQDTSDPQSVIVLNGQGVFHLPTKTVGEDYELATTSDLPLMVTALSAPSTSISLGTKGEIRIDNDYVYICIDTNLWKRSPLTTW